MKFIEFIEKAVPNEKERLQLQEYIGYCLDDKKKFKGVFLLITFDTEYDLGMYEFLRLLTNIALASRVNLNDFISHDFELKPLLCKSINICEWHTCPKNPYPITIIKKIACGEPIEFNLPYQTPFITNELPKLIFTISNKNKISDDLARRAIVVNFSNTPLDTHILDYTYLDMLKWAKAGLRRLRKNKYVFTNNGGTCNG